MGATSSDTRREIAELRAETTALLVDLEGRVRHLLDVRAQIREHPGVAAGAGVAVSAGLGLAAFAVYRNVQQRRSTERRTQERLRLLAEQVAEGLPFRIAARDGRLEIPGFQIEKEPSLGQRVLWNVLATGGTALATYVARQMTESLWSRGFGEPPPTA